MAWDRRSSGGLGLSGGGLGQSGGGLGQSGGGLGLSWVVWDCLGVV